MLVGADEGVAVGAEVGSQLVCCPFEMKPVGQAVQGGKPVVLAVFPTHGSNTEAPLTEKT